MLTIDEQKQIAIERLKQLDVYKPYIKAFKDKGVVTMFENFGGYYATADNGEPELEAKIRAFEAETGCLVYAVTHELTNCGEMYDFLIVNQNDDDYFEMVGNMFYIYAYVWNKTDEMCSKYGDIGVQSFGGGLRRCG